MIAKRHILSLLLLLSLSLNSVKALNLSNEAEISIISCAPGDMIYECFGHTAVRVFDPKRNIDLVFNYGIFEFNKPNFELNFAKGYLEYKLGLSSYTRFLPYYIHGKRTITEQVLNLNDKQKQKLYDYLIWNEKPENRYYFYDYFFDNCATRVRDVVENETGASITYNTNFKNELGYTMRDLIKQYAHNNEWSRLGIDLCLGMAIDRKITDAEYCFLPDYFMKTLATANIDNEPLIKEERTVFKGVKRTTDSWFVSPIFVLWIFSIIFCAIYFSTKKIKLKKGLEIGILSISGFLGMFLLSLWFLTDHDTAQNNLNVLWAMPLHILIPFLKPIWRKRYFLAYAIILVGLLLNWAWFPQSFNNAFFPIVTILAVVSYLKYRNLKNKES